MVIEQLHSRGWRQKAKFKNGCAEIIIYLTIHIYITIWDHLKFEHEAPHLQSAANNIIIELFDQLENAEKFIIVHA
jgi:hypothetical protein